MKQKILLKLFMIMPLMILFSNNCIMTNFQGPKPVAENKIAFVMGGSILTPGLNPDLNGDTDEIGVMPVFSFRYGIGKSMDIGLKLDSWSCTFNYKVNLSGLLSKNSDSPFIFSLTFGGSFYAWSVPSFDAGVLTGVQLGQFTPYLGARASVFLSSEVTEVLGYNLIFGFELFSGKKVGLLVELNYPFSPEFETNGDVEQYGIPNFAIGLRIGGVKKYP